MEKEKLDRSPYMCTAKCFHDGRLFFPETVHLFAPGELPRGKDGKEARHFVPFKGEVPKSGAVSPVQALAERVKELEAKLALKVK